MILTIPLTEAKEELAVLHGVKANEVVIINNEQDLDASFFTNLRAGQKVMACKIIQELFSVEFRDAKEVIDVFSKLLIEK